MIVNLGAVAIADPASEYQRQLALGMPNPNWYRDWLITLNLPSQSLSWFAANPSFANPHVWEMAGVLSQWASSPAEAYRSGSRPTTPSTPPANAEVGTPASFSFSNDTTGNRSLLRVGDRWTLAVRGAPNSDVVIVGGVDGRSDRNTMGKTNASGVWTTQGSPTTAEIGNWSQQIFVGGEPAGILTFQVAPQTSTPPTTPPIVPPATPPVKQSVTETLANQAESLGVPATWVDWATTNPWLIAGGVAALLYFFGRRR